MLSMECDAKAFEAGRWGQTETMKNVQRRMIGDIWKGFVLTALEPHLCSCNTTKSSYRCIVLR